MRGMSAVNSITQDAEFFHLLGHPLRIALLQYLASVPQATATECAPVVGASPSTCSWHLRMLAKGGFVESVIAGDGRVRPWRYTGPQQIQLSNEGPASMLQDAIFQQDRQVVERFLQRKNQYAPEWRASATFVQSVLRINPDQLRDLQKDIQAVMEKYRSLATEMISPPAERVYTTFYAVPWFH